MYRFLGSKTVLAFLIILNAMTFIYGKEKNKIRVNEKVNYVTIDNFKNVLKEKHERTVNLLEQ